MCIDIFHPAPVHPHEALRRRAVEAHRALLATNEPALNDIVERARRSFGTQMASISILHEDWQYLIAASGLATGPYTRRTSFCGHAITEPSGMLYVPDAVADPRFAGNPSVQDGLHIRFYAGAALVDKERLPLGTLCVFDPCPRDQVDPFALAGLRAMAAEVVACIDQRPALIAA